MESFFDDLNGPDDLGLLPTPSESTEPSLCVAGYKIRMNCEVTSENGERTTVAAICEEFQVYGPEGVQSDTETLHDADGEVWLWLDDKKACNFVLGTLDLGPSTLSTNRLLIPQLHLEDHSLILVNKANSLQTSDLYDTDSHIYGDPDILKLSLRMSPRLCGAYQELCGHIPGLQDTSDYRSLVVALIYIVNKSIDKLENKSLMMVPVQNIRPGLHYGPSDLLTLDFYKAFHSVGCLSDQDWKLHTDILRHLGGYGATKEHLLNTYSFLKYYNCRTLAE